MATNETFPLQDDQEHIDAVARKFQETVDSLFDDPKLQKLGIVRKTKLGTVLKLGHIPATNPTQTLEITRFDDFPTDYAVDQTAVRSLRRRAIDTSSTWVTLPRQDTPGSVIQDVISDSDVFTIPEDGIVTPEGVDTLLKTIQTTAKARTDYHWD